MLDCLWGGFANHQSFSRVNQCQSWQGLEILWNLGRVEFLIRNMLLIAFLLAKFCSASTGGSNLYLPLGRAKLTRENWTPEEADSLAALHAQTLCLANGNCQVAEGVRLLPDLWQVAQAVWMVQKSLKSIFFSTSTTLVFCHLHPFTTSHFWRPRGQRDRRQFLPPCLGF